MADAKIRLSVDGSSQVISEFDKVESKMGKLEAIAARAKSSLALMGVGLGVNEIARLSDEYTKYTAQLKLATTSETEFGNAKQMVSKIAKESQSDLAATGVLYARITNGTRELGLSQQKVGAITEAVTLSLKASGATQEESASATLQLSQAFASGTLRGEEFNAVNEAAPRLMRALADGLGVPVGALKNMATEGKITSEVMANTLPKALEDLRKEAAQVQTISGAYTNLKNNVMEFIGAQAQQNGTAAILSTTINTLANNLNYISAAAAGFTTIKVAQKFAEIATSMVSNIAASNELTATKVRETAATVAVAQSNVRETESKLLQLTQTQAAIVGAREEAIAKLNVANATIAQSRAQIQAATSAGALSSALRLVQQGELSLTGAMQARSVATAELAVLGRQQVAISAQATAATTAQAAAQAGLATATAGAATGAGLLSRAVGFLGGPIGAVTTLLGLGVTAWMAWGGASKQASEMAATTVHENAETIIKSLDKQIERHEAVIRLRQQGLSLDQAKNANLDAIKNIDELRKSLADLDATRAEYVRKNEGREALRLAQLTDAARIERDLGVNAVATYYKTKSDAEEKYKKERVATIKEIEGITSKLEIEHLRGIEANAVSYNDKLKKWRDENGTSAQKTAAELAKVKIEFGSIPPEIEKSIRAKHQDKKATDESIISYKGLMKTIGEKIAVAELDIETEKKLTDGQKIAAKFCQDLLSVKNNLTVKQKQEITNSLELLIAKEKINEQTKREEEFAKRAVEDNVRFSESIQESTKNLYAQVATQSEFNSKIGLSKEALVQLESAQLNEDAAKKESIATTMDMVDWTGKLGDEYREQAKQLRELAKLKQTGFAKEADYEQMQSQIKAIAEESKRFSEDINRGLTDALYRGFESGKGFAKSFWDSLKNTAKTMLLKIAVQGVMTGVLGMGAMGTANASPLASMSNIANGGANSFSSLANMATAGKSLWDGFATAGTLGNGFWGSLAGGLNGAGVGSGLTSSLGLDVGNYLQSALGNNVAGSLSSGISSISAAMPYAAAAIAAFQISKSINGGYRIGGLSADAGALLGFAPRLFGMKDKQLGGQTITGALGTQDLMRNQAWSQSGGLFRSDRAGTWSYGLKDSTAVQDGKSYVDSASLSSDKALLAGLNTGYAAVKAASTEFAKALGLNADAIAQRTDALNLTLGKTQEETNAAIQKTFAGIADSIATQLLPGIGEFSKENENAAATLARIASQFVVVNQAFDALGLKLFAMGDAGIHASEKFAQAIGGLDALKNATASYYENFYTQEERNATVIKSLTAEFEKQNLVLPTSREAYRAMVEEVNKLGTPEQLASLLKLNTVFASVVPATDKLVASSEQVLSSATVVEDKFARFTAAADAAASPLVRLTQAVDQVAVAADNSAAILQERQNLQDQLDQLTLTSAQLTEKKRNALFEENRVLFDNIQTVIASKLAAEDLKKVNDEIVQATKQSAESYRELLNGIARNTADLKATQSQTFNNMATAALDGMRAAQKAFQDLADTMTKARDSLLVGSQSGFSADDQLYLLKQQLNGATTAQVPELANEYLAALRANGIGGVDYHREFSAIVNRLDTAAAENQASANQAYDPASLAPFFEHMRALQEKETFQNTFNNELALYSKVGEKYMQMSEEGRDMYRRGNQKFVELDSTRFTNQIDINDQLLKEIQTMRKFAEKTFQVLDQATGGGGAMLIEVA